MNYNEFENKKEKTKIKNIIVGTISVIITLIMVIAIFLLVAKYMKKDNEVDKPKNEYTVTIKSNGSNTKETTLSCYSYKESCQINLPAIIRNDWQIIGWAENENAKQFHLRMWLYVNGIASLVAHQTVEFNDEEIIDLLKDQYVSMLLYEVKKGNVKEEVLVQVVKKNREGKE